MKIINYDMEKITDKNCLSYGFNLGADIQATDVNVSEAGSNFKVKYKGSIVPFWIKGVDMYDILKRIAELIADGKNLVEISNMVKNKSS